uniref:Venom G-protein-like protein 1 n=1 Tax=Ectomocoris sp. TaxID=3104572 RepID=A0AB38ZED9_9HEMI
MCINCLINLKYLVIILSVFIFFVNCESIPKCCPQGYAYDNLNCTESNSSLVNPFISVNSQNVIISLLECGEAGSYYLDPITNPGFDEYFILKNSSLYVEYKHRIISTKEYCIDLMVEIGQVRPLLCFDDEDIIDNATENVLQFYSTGMFLSLPFLISTFLVYLCIRELRTLHGRCLTCQVFTLFVGYGSLGVLQKATDLMDTSHGICVTLGFSVQYFFLATFFWLNVMCIDIYWAFSSLRLVGAVGGETRKLLLYSLYAWGFPLIILLITVAVDFTDFVPATSPFKPKVGINKCFFDDRTSAYMYFYGPMAILLCVNLILFGITACKIWRTKKETSYQLNRTDSRRHSEKQENERFKLYMKLFLVMGINWIAELISFILGEEVPHYLWYVTDLTNTLQGVFIFIIFVWKRRVRRLVIDRLCMFGGRKRISRSRGGTSSDATTTTTTSFNNNTAASVVRLNSVGLVK